MTQNIITVSELNQYIKQQFDRDFFLSQVCVRGEISNYKLYPSGHHYFSLKDAEACVRCVMFRGNAVSLRFRPENGMSVIAVGRVSVFPRDGAYQLYCTALSPDGVGDLHVAYEQIKRKLSAEGLFDEAHKKPIPKYPARIAIVTSSAGAAIHDMLRILKARFPLSKVLLFPVRVQGKEAPGEICEMIRFVNEYNQADLIITGRGGGSIEDLWAFNDEQVCRTIYASGIPVISAVGHEPDVTLSDYVADLRAATPSNAAELAVPDSMELRRKLQTAGVHMAGSVSGQLENAKRRLRRLSEAKVLNDPSYYVQEKRLVLDALDRRLGNASENSLLKKKTSLVRLASGLDAMSPLKVLARGYSMALSEDGSIIKSVADTETGASVTLKVADGNIKAKVTGLEEADNGK